MKNAWAVQDMFESMKKEKTVIQGKAPEEGKRSLLANQESFL